MDLKWASRGPVKAKSLLHRDAGRSGFGGRPALPTAGPTTQAGLAARNRRPRCGWTLRAAARTGAPLGAAARRRGPGCARGGPRPRRVACKRRAPLQPAGHTCDLAGLRLEESRGSDQRLLWEHLSPELRAPGTQSSRASGGDLRVARLWPWGLESHQPPLPLSVRRSRTPSWRCLESGTTGEAAGGTGAEGAGRGWRRGGVGV